MASQDKTVPKGRRAPRGAAKPPGGAAKPPRATTEPPRATTEPPRATTEPPHAATAPPHAATEPPHARRVSRQKEAGEVTRRETRRRLLAAARAEFADRGYAAATVVRISERAGVSVQTLYNDWGNKRNLLQAVMETAVTGDEDTMVEAGQPPAVLTAGLDPGDAKDPRRFLAHLCHQYRLLAERATVGWQTYRDAAGTDPDIAADWQRISEMRRQAFHVMMTRVPAGALRAGLTPAAAADTAWAIASPEMHHQLVREAGYSYDQLEDWVRGTLGAALLPDR
jgi:AcrR family transcriptional regulator